MRLIVEPSERKVIKALEELQKVVNATENRAVKSICEVFIQSIDSVVVMSNLPLLILMHSISHSEALIEGLKVLSKYNKESLDIQHRELVEEFKKKLSEVTLYDVQMAEKRYNQLKSRGGSIWISIELERIANIHQESFINLMNSSVIWTWTVFEVCATDLWEAALNTNFNTIGRDAFMRMAKGNLPLGAEAKQVGKIIRIDYVVKYDFNIKDNVGGILKQYFDFSTLDGIREAYKHIFPRSTAVQTALSNQDLWMLSQDRNLIVHRAGYIDSKYKSATKTTLNIGERLIIADAQNDLYQIAAVNVIRAILSCINKYSKLQEN